MQMGAPKMSPMFDSNHHQADESVSSIPVLSLASRVPLNAAAYVYVLFKKSSRRDLQSHLYVM